jgi:sugar phosphate isomerase/epimerase
MKIGLVTDSLGDHSLSALLDVAAEIGIESLEFTTGAWGAAPHLDLAALLANGSLRRDFMAMIGERALTISALNCSGNPLHPGPSGKEHALTARRTVELASLLGVDKVVMMSGCPAAPGDAYPNWITVAWPPEVTRVLEWQWREMVLPFWREFAGFARDQGVAPCLELHGHQNVYSVDTFFRLRETVGEAVGVNFDPSHLMWMGADPIAAIEALGTCIYHVHAKDTRLHPVLLPRNGRLETTPSIRPEQRSWNYVTLGDGHDAEFWHRFCRGLEAVGYRDALSIEHEDASLTPLEGVTRSVELLARVR